MDAAEIARIVMDGQLWQAGTALAPLAEAQVGAVAQEVARQASSAGDTVEVIANLISAAAPRVALEAREKLAGLEALRHLAAHVALESKGEDWEELIPAIRTLGVDVSQRVREVIVRLVARIASKDFEGSKSFWQECLEDEEGPLGGSVIRGLAISEAPVPGVLDLIGTRLSDFRKDIRHSLGPTALARLGKRDPQVVYEKLKEWARRADEITRWNVAKALGTPLGGVNIEGAMEILEILAADERPSVWRAAGEALVHIAERRPAFVLPILSRWRGDPARQKAANLALSTLARRR